MQQKRYYELDALRGIAALYVVLFHYSLGHYQYVWLANLGVSAVDMFFMISGFVIFMSISNVSSVREFAINRISRLYPTYWACVTFSFACMMLLKVVHFHTNHLIIFKLSDYLANLTMFQYYLNRPNIEVPYWTMTIEMLFYLFVMVLLKLKLLQYFTLIGCIFNSFIIINFVLINNGFITNHNAVFPLVNHFALFFAGITFFKISNNMQKVVPGFIVITFCFITQVTIFKFAGSDPGHISHFEYIAMLIIYFAVFSLFIFGKLKFLILKPLLFLGKISYALYLIHYYLFVGLIGYFENHLHIHFWVSTLFVALPLALLFAALITEYIEIPLARKFKAFLLSL